MSSQMIDSAVLNNEDALSDEMEMEELRSC